jgi:hypothetical protein
MSEAKQELERARQRLKTLGDEIRVKLHLAGLDAKEAWAKLSHEADKASRSAEERSVARLDELAERLKKLARAIEEHAERPGRGGDPEC